VEQSGSFRSRLLLTAQEYQFTIPGGDRLLFFFFFFFPELHQQLHQRKQRALYD
jgi:hypothetical protein